MPYYYTSVLLDPDRFKNYRIGDKSLETFDGMSALNIFIGSNNSGKSRFMRELAKTNEMVFHRSGMELAELETAFDNFMKEFSPTWTVFSNYVVNGTVEEYGHLTPTDIDFASYIPHVFNEAAFAENSHNPRTLRDLLVTLRDNKISFSTHRGNPQQAITDLQQSLSNDYATDFLKVLESFIFEKIDFKKYYLPTLRSLNDFDAYQTDPEHDIFSKRIKQVYNFDDTVDIFSGQILYERITEMLLGDHQERERMRHYERFLSEKIFDNQDIVIIPKKHGDVVYVKIGREEYPIYELGDGIQSLIMLTFPLFECEHGLFFIEEPETNLHPGMQRKFMEALQAHPQHQYFITTHSNHLLDLTVEYTNVSIYTFDKRVAEDSITHQVDLVTRGEKNILELIGARNTSMFLSNKTIWVEGITDRLYIGKYLELYMNEKNRLRMRQDIDYSFMEYGGNNITHWSFLESSDPTINVDRLCGKLMLVTDQDGNKKMDRKAELKAKLGERYYLLETREIENTLSLERLGEVLATYEGARFKLPNSIDPETMRTTLLGTFIEDSIFPGETYVRKGGYKDTSGTIKSKLAFCNRAIDGMTYKDMTQDAVNLAEAIYNFISKA